MNERIFTMMAQEKYVEAEIAAEQEFNDARFSGGNGAPELTALARLSVAIAVLRGRRDELLPKWLEPHSASFSPTRFNV